jgi:hypothetical protein
MTLTLAILLSIVFIQKQQNQRRTAANITLLEGQKLNAIDEVAITSGSHTVTLIKTDGCWKVKELYNYPVDFDKLAEALRIVADIKQGSPIQTNEFGLDKKLTLKSGGSTTLTLELGAQRDGSRLIRKNSTAEVYLVNYDFQPFNNKPTDWIQKEILNIAPDELSNETDNPQNAWQNLNCLTLADPAKSDAELGFTEPRIYVARDRDGLTYTATLGGKNKAGRYARFSVTCPRPEAPAADAPQKEKDDFTQTNQYHQQTAARLNKNLAGWTFVISDRRADLFIEPQTIQNTLPPE